MNQYASAIAGKLNLRTSHVEAVLQLFDEGGTVPFIARYRKDKTGAMDEVAIQQVQDEAKRLAEFDERKAAMVAMAIFGIGLVGGSQIGYASLVDLQTGRVGWFNDLRRASGDLREAKNAAETVDALLRSCPPAR